MLGEDTDLYLVLGLAPTATRPEIVRAFRRMLRRHHPDTRTEHGRVGGEDDQKLGQILAAYAVLRDPARRAEYDRHHHLPGRVTDSPPAGQTVHVHHAPPGDSRPPLWAGPVFKHRPSST